MIEAERIRIEQRIQEKGTPQHLERFRAAHAGDAGEPLSAVDFRLYEIVLEQRGGVPAVDAVKKVGVVKEMYQKGDENEKNRIANIVQSAVEGLTGERILRPQPVGVLNNEVIVFSNK